jgi:hypothetical protein
MDILRRLTRLLVTAVIPFLAGCGTTEISSGWRQSDAGISAPGETQAGSAFGDRRISGTVSNDGEYMYVTIRTNNRDLSRLILREGIMLWFDGEGGGKRAFGIHYPLASPGPSAGGRMSESDATPPPPGREVWVQPPQELELFNGEKEHQRMSILAAGGIEAGVRRRIDTLVCEFRVPLAPGAVHPFGIGAKPGTPLGLGIVTTSLNEAPDLPADRAEGEGEPEGGFGGRRSGGAGSRTRGAGRPEGADRTDQLNLWLKVHLATSPR